MDNLGIQIRIVSYFKREIPLLHKVILLSYFGKKSEDSGWINVGESVLREILRALNTSCVYFKLHNFNIFRWGTQLSYGFKGETFLASAESTELRKMKKLITDLIDNKLDTVKEEDFCLSAELIQSIENKYLKLFIRKVDPDKLFLGK